MKRYIPLMLLATFIVSLAACSTNSKLGSKVKEPFSSNKYESNNRWFRSVGKGDSKDDNIAKNKADLQAKKELAQQVSTNLKVVSDQYFSDTETENSSEVNDKFQSLAREVTNTTIGDLRKIGEEKYYNAEEDRYTVFIAYEIKKNAMFRFMKKKARTDKKIDSATRQILEDILDKEIERIEALDND